MKTLIKNSIVFSALLVVGIPQVQAGDCFSPCLVSGPGPQLIFGDTSIGHEDWSIDKGLSYNHGGPQRRTLGISIDRAGSDQYLFVIHPDAFPSALVLYQSRYVGINHPFPEASLHVSSGIFDDNPPPVQVLVEQNKFRSTVAARTLFKLKNPGNTKFGIENTDTGEEWAFAVPGASLRFSKQGTGTVEAEFDSFGNLFLAGSVVEGSSRSIKHDIVTVDTQDVLEKVLAMPIARWTYNRDSDDVRHMGPMAEDFHTAFGLGKTNKGITSLDSSGVALASIQALHKHLEAKGQQIETLKKELSSQKKDLADLKRMVQALVAKDQVATLNVLE